MTIGHIPPSLRGRCSKRKRHVVDIGLTMFCVFLVSSGCAAAEKPIPILEYAKLRRPTAVCRIAQGEVVGLLLQGTEVCDNDLERIGELPHLANLVLDRTAVTDQGLAHIGKALSLTRLSQFAAKMIVSP